MYNGNYKVDFGVEVSGWVKFTGVEGPEGQKIEIKYLSNSYSGDNSYIFSGKGKEDYAARFNWFIFREVEIVNWPGILAPEQITAEVVHTDVKESAVFETSNPMFNTVNKIWKTQSDRQYARRHCKRLPAPRTFALHRRRTGFVCYRNAQFRCP